MPRFWTVWGINPATEQLVELVIIADNQHTACRQMERCGLLLVDAAQYQPDADLDVLLSR